MAVRRLGTVDLETGEPLQGTLVLVWPKTKSPYGTEFMVSHQPFVIQLAARKDASKDVFRVFMYVNGRLDFNNLIHLSQVEISEALGIKRQNVSRAMRWLIDNGVVEKGPKVGNSQTYRLNPNAGWKGKVTELDKALKQRRQPAPSGEPHGHADLLTSSGVHSVHEPAE
jgi:hypothetical protein